MRVLLAETDAALAAELQHAFEANGGTVTAVSSSLAAWDLLAKDPPDLLVTRLAFGVGQVPGTALGAVASSKRIPVIYMPSDAARAADAHAEHGAVLIKPFSGAALVARARELLSTSKAKP